MGFKKSKVHGKVYNDDKPKKGNVTNHPGNHDGSTNLVRESVDVHEEIKKETEKHGGVTIESVTWHDGENTSVKYKLDKYGDIEFIGGFENAIEEIGGHPISNSEIRDMIEWDEQNGDTDVSVDDYDEDAEQAVYDYLNEKENDNTYNYSSALAKDLNYGFFESEMNGKQYMAFKEHSGTGDVRGGYGDNMLYDISDVDTGVSGEPKVDVGILINPEFLITLNHKGKKYDVRKDGGANGFFNIEEYEDGGSPDDDKEKQIKGEYNGNLYGAFDDYVEKHGE